MKVIVCLDDNNGMMFNHRRQSRDEKVIEKIFEITKNSRLWVNKYSYSLFEIFNTSNINVDDAFLSEAPKGEYCFVENPELLSYEKWIEEIIVFRWNRDYPYDKELDIDLSKWELKNSIEFEGNSHKKITMEVYSR